MRSDTIFTALDERRKGKGKFTSTDTFRSEIRYYYYPLETRQKCKFTPYETSRSEIRYYFNPLDKRQKSKFTPSETSTSEIRYYLTSWTKGKKTNLLHLIPPHLRSDTSPSPSPGQKQKWKKATLLYLRPPDLILDTIFTPLDKRQKGKFTTSETSRSEIRC